MDKSSFGTDKDKREVAVLAGGCFWCLEAVYDQVKGVTDVVSGYVGGHTHNPTYEQVCSGLTGHAEVVKVTFDPDVISYEEILGIFFSIHDPTTLNRQGADVGTQYRSAIFYTSSQQKDTAEAMLRQLAEEKVWKNPIVTEIKPLDVFFPAEDYHQEYFSRNPYQGYCQFVVAPKVNKFKKKYADLLKGK
jgi:peptide-methionine (S)-S-oxide reductase